MCQASYKGIWCLVQCTGAGIQRLFLARFYSNSEHGRAWTSISIGWHKPKDKTHWLGTGPQNCGWWCVTGSKYWIQTLEFTQGIGNRLLQKPQVAWVRFNNYSCNTWNSVKDSFGRICSQAFLSSFPSTFFLLFAQGQGRESEYIFLLILNDARWSKSWRIRQRLFLK